MRRVRLNILQLGRLPVHAISFLVWLATVGCVLLLFTHRARRFEVVGLAQGRVYQVAANCEGRLKEVRVQLFDKVTKGQELVLIDTILDNENLQAQLETARAEVQHLQAQLAPMQQRLTAEAANLETDGIAAQRRFAVDVENARIGILELKTLLATDRVTLEELAVELNIVRGLAEQEAVAPYELQKAQTQYNAIAKKIEENEHVLEQATKDFLQAERRREEFAKRQVQYPPVDSELEVIRKAVEVQQKCVDELLARGKALTLQSPFEGVVSRVLRAAGEAVRAGDPILTVAEARPTEVIAYTRQEHLGLVKERMVVELIKTSEPPRAAGSQVVYLGPTMELMPQQLWRNPNIPQWGRPVLIKVPPGLELVAGEVVGVRGL